MVSMYWAAIAAAAIGLSLASPSVAADAPTGGAAVDLTHMTLGYTYYNRPGADMAAHDEAVAACAREAAKLHTPKENAYATGPFGGVLGVMLDDALADASHRGAAAAGLENCMVVRGWRVVQLSETDGSALAKLSPADLAAQLQPWVGATAPHGDIVRVWSNDAAHAATIRYASDAAHFNNGQLSLKAVTANNLNQFKRAATRLGAYSNHLDPKWPKGRLTPKDLAAAPAEGGVIIVWIKNLSFRSGGQIILNRVGPDIDLPPSNTDHAPDQLIAGNPFFKKQNVFAFAVPAGRWRIQGIGGVSSLNFCLGAPSFEVKPGEVVFAGTFDFAAADLTPDLSLEPVKGWLAGQPATAAVRPAVYTNGSLGGCGYSAIYALEFTGAPFEPGYHWGSRVNAPIDGAQ